MSDALFIAVGATGIAAVVLGVVTWMLILPARVARSAQDRLEVPAPPLERVAALISETAAAPERHACLEEGLAPQEIRQALEQAAEAAAAGDAAARDRRRRLAGVLRAVAAEHSTAAEEAAHAAAGLEATLAALDAPPPPLDSDATPSLTDPQWDAWVAAPSLDPGRSALAALLSWEVLGWQAGPPERYGLSRRQRAEQLSAPPRITGLGPAVARILQVPTPVFYVAPERDERLIHVNLALNGQLIPGVVVGSEALAFEDAEAVLWFMLGRKLAFLRPEHRLCTVVDGAAELRALHLAVAQILAPGTLAEAPDPLLGLPRDLALGKLRQYLLEAERAALARQVLRSLGERCPGSDPAEEALWAEWLLASAETSFRCGLLLSGHLGAALRVLDLDGLLPGGHSPPSGCYQALYPFYLSERYEQARAWLTDASV
jgi:hypothetical protein